MPVKNCVGQTTPNLCPGRDTKCCHLNRPTTSQLTSMEQTNRTTSIVAMTEIRKTATTTQRIFIETASPAVTSGPNWIVIGSALGGTICFIIFIVMIYQFGYRKKTLNLKVFSSRRVQPGYATGVHRYVDETHSSVEVKLDDHQYSFETEEQPKVTF